MHTLNVYDNIVQYSMVSCVKATHTGFTFLQIRSVKDANPSADKSVGSPSTWEVPV